MSLDQALAPATTLPELTASGAGVLVPRLGAQLSAWSTVDPAHSLGTRCFPFDAGVSPVRLGPAELVRERTLFELEWLDTDPKTFAALRREGRTTGALRADVGDFSTVARYRELLAPLGVADEHLLADLDDDHARAAVAAVAPGHG